MRRSSCPGASFRRRLRWIAILFPLLVADLATATMLRPEVIVDALAPQRALKDGEDFSIPIEVLVRDDVTLERIEIPGGPSLGRVVLEPSSSSRRSAAEGYRIERRVLRGTLVPGLESIQLRVTVNGEEWNHELGLRGSLDVEVGADALPPYEAVEVPAIDSRRDRRPAPAASGYATVDEIGLARRAERDVAVTGRIEFRLNDTGNSHGADGVSVYLFRTEGFLNDVELGSGTTDSLGNFSFTARVDGTPEVYLKVRAENDDVCNVGVNYTMDTYGANLMRTPGFAGTTFNAGTVRFTGPMNHAMFLVTMFTRNHRWYGERGFDLPRVDVQWPEDITGSSYYAAVLGYERIHLRSAATWSGRTATHEYGHHFVEQSDLNHDYPPFYLNGFCDPGHCGGCPENEGVAWLEGVPNFMSRVVNDALRDRYGWEPPGRNSYESIGNCPDTSALTTLPLETEDAVAAFLVDLIDDAPDRGPFVGPEFLREFSSIPLTAIFEVAIATQVDQSSDFVFEMFDWAAANLSEQERQEVWAAAIMNGLADDTTRPSVPSSLDTPLHPTVAPTPAAVPQIVIGPATDAGAGVVGYLVSIDDSAQYPGPGAFFTRVTDFLWPAALPPGGHTINVVAVDRAGNTSANYATRRITVGEPFPVDLAMFQPDLWEDSFLVTNEPTTNPATVAIDPILPASQDVYVHVMTANIGAGSAGLTRLRNTHQLDGENFGVYEYDESVMEPGETYGFTNRLTDRFFGGRHLYSIRLDASHALAESDEVNNQVDRHVVIIPDVLAPGSWTPFPVPPLAYTAVSDVEQPWPNVRGHRIAPTNVFAGVQMATAEPATENALWAHAPASDWQTGFDLPIARSDDDAGEIETLVINQAALGGTVFDVGVERQSVGTLDDYTIRHVSSRTESPGGTVSVNWTDQDALEVVEYFFDVTQTGNVDVRVDAIFDPADPYDTLDVYWMTPTLPSLVPALTTPVATITGDGNATVNLNAPTSGSYALVLHRPMPFNPTAAPRPMGSALARTALDPVQIQIVTSTGGLPDLTIFRENPFFDLPFLPSFEPQAGPKVGLPAVLTALEPSTFLNFALRNQGIGVAEDLLFRVTLEDPQGPSLLYSEVDLPQGLPGLSNATFFGTNGLTVPGGRRTLVLALDPDDQVEEFDETNNVFAVQMGWEGLALQPLEILERGAPPLPNAGRDLVEVFVAPTGTGGEDPLEVPVNEWHVNADGFQIESALARAVDGAWIAVATMPDGDGDVDLHLHDVLPPVAAYGRPLVSSRFETGQSDFVVIDRTRASRAFDVSVSNEGGDAAYAIVQVPSVSLGGIEGEEVQFGPFGMDAPGYLQLYEVDLAPGRHTIKLEPLGGAADLGVSVFPPTQPFEAPYRSKDDGTDRFPMAYDAPAGAPDVVQFDVPWGAEGSHALAVWKVDASDRQENEDYVLTVAWEPTAAPCIATDGAADAAYGSALAIQTTQTSFGNATLGVVDEANGSELDQLFAEVCDDVLHVTLAGNLVSNDANVELFVDVGLGGQNPLRDEVVGFGPDTGVNRLGGDGSESGLRFEAGFEPDHWFGVDGGGSEPFDGQLYTLRAYSASLPSGGGAAAKFLGVTAAGAAGLLSGGATDNPHGIRVAIDNRNVAGVDAGTGAASGSGVTTGIEWSIPLEALGNPTDCLRLVAFVTSRDRDVVSNQFLPPVVPGTGSLGDPRSVDMSVLDGRQYEIVCQGTATAVDDEAPLRGRVAVLEAPAPNPFNPSTRLAFRLERAERVQLTIYDVAGRRVRSLVDGDLFDAGRHALTWQGRDDDGRIVGSGSYLLRLTTESGAREVQRLLLLK